MDARTARILAALTSEFYRTHAASFSAARTRPWEGWRACIAGWDEGAQCVSVLDLGCGNLRFEAFLARERPDASVTAHAVDNCEFPAPDGRAPRFGASNARVLRYGVDAVGALVEGAYGEGAARSLEAALAEVPACDLSVAFGFLHHVPGEAARQGALGALAEKTRPGGRIAVSLWRFLEDPSFAAKAHREHDQALSALAAEGALDAGALAAALDEGDRLLGWKGSSIAQRFCHSFSEAEIERLIDSVADRACLVRRFEADGKTGRMNTYLVFEAL